MISSDNLFQLIKSLSLSEKRYFKLLSAKHVVGDENNYIKLFDAIESQTKHNKYNEEVIKKKFEKEKFVKHFAFHKNYLYNLLLDSLHVYHINLGADARLQKQLHQSTILFQRGLYSQCKTLIEKTKNECVKMERYQFHYEAIVIEKKLIKASSFSNTTEDTLLKLYQEGSKALNQVKNVDEYMNLQDHLIFLFNKSGEVRSGENKKKYDAIMLNPLLRNESRAVTVTEKRLFNNIHTIYNLSAGNSFENAFRYVNRCLQLLEAAPALIKEDPNSYVAILTNFLSVCSQYNRFTDTLQAIEKMREISKTYKIKLNSSLEIKIFINAALFELNQYACMGEFEKITNAIKGIENGLSFFSGKINSAAEKILVYNIACMYFGSGNYKKTIEWLNKILNEKEADTKQDIISFAKILQFITHLELKNTDLLPYIVKSTQNFLDKRNRIHKGETIVLNFIKQFNKTGSKKELLAVYRKTHKAFLQLRNQPLEKNFFRYFDFISWVESKITNTSFSEIVRNNYRQHRIS